MARRFHQSITALLIAALSLQPAGCSTVPTQRQQQQVIGGTAVDVAPDDDGWIRLHAVPRWSNGESGKEHLSFQAEKRDGYLLFAYERGHGLVPVSVEKAPPPSTPPSSGSSLFSNLGVGGPDPMGAGFLIMVALVAYGVSLLVKDLAKPRYPSAGCCFLWVEDAETGETLAGTPPWKLERPASG